VRGGGAVTGQKGHLSEKGYYAPGCKNKGRERVGKSYFGAVTLRTLQ